MTHRISSLACFCVPWKRKPLFQRAMWNQGSNIPYAHVSNTYVPLLGSYTALNFRRTGCASVGVATGRGAIADEVLFILLFEHVDKETAFL